MSELVERHLSYLVTHACREDVGVDVAERFLLDTACNWLRREGEEPVEGARVAWRQMPNPYNFVAHEDGTVTGAPWLAEVSVFVAVSS